MTLVRHSVVLLAEALAVAGLLGLAVVRPLIDPPARADVVVLLSGDGGRLPGALRLMQQRVAPTLLFLGQPDTQAVADLCREPQSFAVICIRPRPDDTRTEARAAGREARTRNWHSMVLVTSRYHITRARILFRRCFGGDLHTTGYTPDYGPTFARHEIAHEWLGLVYASVLARGC